MIAIAIAQNADAFRDTFANGVATVASLTVIAALALGWVAGGPLRSRRIVVGLVTAVRANALAIAIARASFPNQRSIIVAIVVFGLVSITVSVAVALFIGHGSSGRALAELEEDG